MCRLTHCRGLSTRCALAHGGVRCRVRIRTQVHTAETIINIERDVLSLSAPKRLFRAIESAVPHNDLGMVVTRVRREKNGIEVGHRIDRTDMH